MRQTGVGLADKRLTIAIIVIPFINLGLSNTAAEINFGALAESIDIASGSADVGNIIIFLIAFIGTRKYKANPILMIIACGIAGLLLY